MEKLPKEGKQEFPIEGFANQIKDKVLLFLDRCQKGEMARAEAMKVATEEFETTLNTMGIE